MSTPRKVRALKRRIESADTFDELRKCLLEVLATVVGGADDDRLTARYGDRARVVAAALDAVASTRSTGKIAPGVRDAIVTKLEQYDADAVVAACTIYVDGGHHVDGKKENYLYGIVRSQVRCAAGTAKVAMRRQYEPGMGP